MNIIKRQKINSAHHWILSVGICATTLSSTVFAEDFTAVHCNSMKKVTLPNVTISHTERVTAGKSGEDPMRELTGASGANHDLPTHCLVKGTIGARTGSDGKPYGIQFELRMPDNWQNRFMFQGGGGTDGFLAQAIGSIPSSGSSAPPSLARGYAVVSMDGGHQGLDLSFAADQQARLDFAYSAVGKVTDQAKYLISKYYDEPSRHSYFMGCSNGGREAMIAAQRYPTEFDGVVAGNAGFHLTRAAVAEAWDTQVLLSIAPKDKQGNPILSQALTNHDLHLVSQAVLKQCDAKDGIKDGIINNYPECDFKLDVLQCKKEGETDNCLSSEKVAAIDKIFKGAHNSQGKALYSSWPYDAGISSIGWRVWKLGTSTDANKPNAINATMGASALVNYFMTPPAPDMKVTQFDFDADIVKTKETGALHDALSTYMNTYRSRGGKMLIFHGFSDPVFSANDIINWYQRLLQNTDHGDFSRQQEWTRLFMVPGMTHCGGGPALDDFDPLQAIEDWVEQNKAPDYLTASAKAFPDKKQPLCPYPKTARYNGKGDPNQLDSYSCK